MHGDEGGKGGGAYAHGSRGNTARSFQTCFLRKWHISGREVVVRFISGGKWGGGGGGRVTLLATSIVCL